MMLGKTLLALFAAAAAVASPIAGGDLADRSTEVNLDDRSETVPIEARALCPGNVIERKDLFSNKATLWVFYSSADGGINCAYLNNNTGKRARMSITMIDWDEPDRGRPTDSGKFIEYAGPVRLNRMATHCFQITAVFKDKGWASRQKWHC